MGTIIVNSPPVSIGTNTQVELQPSHDIIVSRVKVDGPTWLVAQRNEAGQIGQVLGTKLLNSGSYESLALPLDSSVNDEDQIWLSLYLDQGAIGKLEIPALDLPIRQDGKPINVLVTVRMPAPNILPISGAANMGAMQGTSLVVIPLIVVLLLGLQWISVRLKAT